MDLSLGGVRTLELRPKGAEAAEEAIPLTSGSLFLLSTATNETWQHRVRPERGEVQPRVSIVCRDISSVVPRSKVQRMTHAKAKKRAAAAQV